MKLLQILVWILLFMISYDLLTYVLQQRNEGEPAEGEGAGQWNSIIGYDGIDIRPFIHWLVGSAAIVVIVVLRVFFKRVLPTPNEVPGATVDEQKVDPAPLKKRESFLTCRISDTTINTYTDDATYEIAGQLSPSQLQVLLEELKFSVDEKFEEIDNWITSNERDLKLWLKRLERVETELSYIRHQIFILMSSNAKLGSTLCIGDVPDARDHVETLRDLSTILAQVKQQFNENELKGKKVREYGDHGENYLHPKSFIMQELNEHKQNLVTLKNIEAQQRNLILNDLKSRQNLKKSSIESKNYSSDEEETEKKTIKEQFTNTNDSHVTVVTIGSETKDDTPYQSDKDSSNPTCNKEDESVQEKWEDAKRLECSKDSPRSERSSSPKNSSTISLTKTLTEEYDATPPPIKRNVSPDSKNNDITQENNFNNNIIAEESLVSTNFINIETPPTQLELSRQRNNANKENATLSALPKRIVRFAQEKRDVSPSKSPTWLGIKRDPSPIKPYEIKDGSDPVVISAPCNDSCNVYRDSVSCPAVDDKRPSRRSLMEKELNNLERRASPSPSRRRKPNVRSKVADYIRGSKN